MLGAGAAARCRAFGSSPIANRPLVARTMRSTTSRGRAAATSRRSPPRRRRSRRRRCRRTFRRRRRRRPAVRALPLRRSRRRTSSCRGTAPTPRSRCGRACGTPSETSRSIRGLSGRDDAAREAGHGLVRCVREEHRRLRQLQLEQQRCHRPRHQIYPRVQQRRPSNGAASSACSATAALPTMAPSRTSVPARIAPPPRRRSRRQRAAARPYVRRGCTVRRRRAGPFRRVRRRWPGTAERERHVLHRAAVVRASARCPSACEYRAVSTLPAPTAGLMTYSPSSGSRGSSPGWSTAVGTTGTPRGGQLGEIRLVGVPREHVRSVA